MAGLATSVTGDGNVTASGISTNISQRVVEYTDGKPSAWANVKEVTARETREWVALTQSAAEDEKAANVQPAVGEGTYTYDVSEDNRVIGSYKLQRMFEHKVTTLETPPQCETPTFDPAAGAFEAGALAVEVTSETPNATIYWFLQVGAVLTQGSVANGGTVNVTVPCKLSCTAVKAFHENSEIATAEYTEEA